MAKKPTRLTLGRSANDGLVNPAHHRFHLSSLSGSYHTRLRNRTCFERGSFCCSVECSVTSSFQLLVSRLSRILRFRTLLSAAQILESIRLLRGPGRKSSRRCMRRYRSRHPIANVIGGVKHSNRFSYSEAPFENNDRGTPERLEFVGWSQLPKYRRTLKNGNAHVDQTRFSASIVNVPSASLRLPHFRIAA